MSERSWIWIPTGLALSVVAVCFAASGSTLDGVVLATRYSARFSGLVLATAVLARAARPIALHLHRVSLTLAFTAAHGVHYGTVILRAFVDPNHKLRHPGPIDLVGLIGGFGLIVVIALTARATATRASRLNALAFYTAWAILSAASASRVATSVPSLVVLTALVAAMLWRVGGSVVARTRPLPSGGA